jgi:hypothetical protein
VCAVLLVSLLTVTRSERALVDATELKMDNLPLLPLTSTSPCSPPHNHLKALLLLWTAQACSSLPSRAPISLSHSFSSSLLFSSVERLPRASGHLQAWSGARPSTVNRYNSDGTARWSHRGCWLTVRRASSLSPHFCLTFFPLQSLFQVSGSIVVDSGGSSILRVEYAFWWRCRVPLYVHVSAAFSPFASLDCSVPPPFAHGKRSQPSSALS